MRSFYRLRLPSPALYPAIACEEAEPAVSPRGSEGVDQKRAGKSVPAPHPPRGIWRGPGAGAGYGSGDCNVVEPDISPPPGNKLIGPRWRVRATGNFSGGSKWHFWTECPKKTSIFFIDWKWEGSCGSLGCLGCKDVIGDNFHWRAPFGEGKRITNNLK